MSILLILLLFKNISQYINFNMRDYMHSQVKKENTLILKEAFLHERNTGDKIENMIKIVKNSKEEIVEVDFDIERCTEYLYNVINYMNDVFEDYNYRGYRLDLPLGYITKNPFLMNLGPKIPIKVEIGDTALGNVFTTVKDFGINNALLELYVQIDLSTMILYPFETLEEKTTYKTLLSSKVISGVVPDFYNGVINSESETIDLPITK